MSRIRFVSEVLGADVANFLWQPVLGHCLVILRRTSFTLNHLPEVFTFFLPLLGLLVFGLVRIGFLFFLYWRFGGYGGPSGFRVSFFLEDRLADFDVLFQGFPLESSAAAFRALVESLELGVLGFELHVDVVLDVFHADDLGLDLVGCWLRFSSFCSQ